MKKIFILALMTLLSNNKNFTIDAQRIKKVKLTHDNRDYGIAFILDSEDPVKDTVRVTSFLCQNGLFEKIEPTSKKNYHLIINNIDDTISNRKLTLYCSKEFAKYATKQNITDALKDFFSELKQTAHKDLIEHISFSEINAYEFLVFKNIVEKIQDKKQ